VAKHSIDELKLFRVVLPEEQYKSRPSVEGSNPGSVATIPNKVKLESNMQHI